MWAYDRNCRTCRTRRIKRGSDLGGPRHTAEKPLQLDFVYEQSQALTRFSRRAGSRGIDAVNIEVHPRSQLSSMIYGGYTAGGTLSTGKYDLSTYQWYAGIDPIIQRSSCARIVPRTGSISHTIVRPNGRRASTGIGELRQRNP